MSAGKWKTTTHTVPAAHMRGFARGAKDEFSDQQIRLAVKQYTPLSNPYPSKGDVTFVMSGGLSVSKESFEPYFDALLDASEAPTSQFRIRSIWIADPWNTGESYYLNQDIVGDDPHWLDHTRDLYNIINHFARDMPQPLIGMGESWGAGHFCVMNNWHPRLFAGILLLEPALGPGHDLQGWEYGDTLVNWPTKPKYFPGCIASKRPDRWESREEAVKHLSRSPFYAQMDPCVRAIALQHDLRDVTDKNGSYTTLATPKAIEAQFWGRSEPPLSGLPPYPHFEEPNAKARHVPGFFRNEGIDFHAAVKHVTCPIFFLWGGKSFLSTMPDYKESFMRTTGSAPGAGGGESTRQITSAMIKDGQHAITLTHPDESAKAAVPWVARTAREWMEGYERVRSGRPFERGLSKEWLDKVHALDDLPGPAIPSKPSKL